MKSELEGSLAAVRLHVIVFDEDYQLLIKKIETFGNI